MKDDPQIAALLAFCIRVGRNPLLVQASSGNVSLKTGGVLWIKASGKWLAYVRADESFVLLDLPRVRESVKKNLEYCGSGASDREGPLRASIETAMHAVLPHRIVVHVHSVNTIAWAVRRDGPERLAERLDGMAWQWVPYVASGLPLARAIDHALSLSPGANVFVLQNHGLVICGESSDEVEALLIEVERRVMIHPRRVPAHDFTLTLEIAGNARWMLPQDEEVHAFGLDVASRRILDAGVLYPCQSVFLGPSIPVIPNSAPAAIALKRIEYEHTAPSFCIVEGRGVIVSRSMSKAQTDVLSGLVSVVQRLDESAPLRYLQEWELSELQTADACQYRKCAEENFAAENYCEAEQSFV